jgi:hypothetical protein
LKADFDKEPNPERNALLVGLAANGPLESLPSNRN